MHQRQMMCASPPALVQKPSAYKTKAKRIEATTLEHFPKQRDSYAYELGKDEGKLSMRATRKFKRSSRCLGEKWWTIQGGIMMTHP